MKLEKKNRHGGRRYGREGKFRIAFPFFRSAGLRAGDFREA